MTSKTARSALNAYLRDHAELRDEIQARLGAVQGLEHVEEDSVEEQDDLDPAGDDSDVSSSAVIHSAVGLKISDAEGAEEEYINGQEGFLTSTGGHEDVWAWDEGERLGERLPAE